MANFLSLEYNFLPHKNFLLQVMGPMKNKIILQKKIAYFFYGTEATGDTILCSCLRMKCIEGLFPEHSNALSIAFSLIFF